MRSSKSWFKEEHVDKVQRSGSVGGYSIGEKVEMRDGGENWRVGHVTSVSPLKVTMSKGGKGYGWDEVRKHR